MEFAFVVDVGEALHRGGVAFLGLVLHMEVLKLRQAFLLVVNHFSVELRVNQV
jgi:hypothetical protein